jgi:hypothetical protein
MRREIINTKVQVRLVKVREPHKGVILQSATGEELSALLPSVLDRAFKGELMEEIEDIQPQKAGPRGKKTNIKG